MSLFYLKNEPSISIIAPTDGTVLPFDENVYDAEKESLWLSVSSSKIVSPLNGTLKEIIPERSECTLVGDIGEIITLKLFSESVSLYTSHTHEIKLKILERLCL